MNLIKLSNSFRICLQTFQISVLVSFCNNMLKTGIKSRVTAENTCYFFLRNILKLFLISWTTKLKIYKPVIKPIVIYCSATWAITQKYKKFILIWEMKIFSQILRPIKVGYTGKSDQIQRLKSYITKIIYKIPLK